MPIGMRFPTRLFGLTLFLQALANEGELAFDLALGAAKLLGDLAILVTNSRSTAI